MGSQCGPTHARRRRKCERECQGSRIDAVLVMETMRGRVREGVARGRRCCAPGVGSWSRRSLCSRCWRVGSAWSGAFRRLAAIGHGFLSSLSEAPAGTPLVGAGCGGGGSCGRVRCSWAIRAPGLWMCTARRGCLRRGSAKACFAVGVAVDEASGDVYVADPVQDAVLVYEADGTGGYRLLGRWSGGRAPGGSSGKSRGWRSITPVGLGGRCVCGGGEEPLVWKGGRWMCSSRSRRIRKKAKAKAKAVFVRRLSGPKLEEPERCRGESFDGQGAGGGQREGRDLRVQRGRGL